MSVLRSPRTAEALTRQDDWGIGYKLRPCGVVEGAPKEGAPKGPLHGSS